MSTPDNPSYIPIHYVGFSGRMSFMQRVLNTIFLVYHKFIYAAKSRPAEERILKSHFGLDMIDLEELAQNTSAILVYTHHSLSGAIPRSPNIIEVGGMHLGTVKKLSIVS